MATELPPDPQPTDDPDLSYDDSLTADLNVAARALTLGAALYAPEVHNGLSDELAAIGFSDLPPPAGDALSRSLLLESDAMLDEFGLGQLVARREREAVWRPRRARSGRASHRTLWSQASSGDPVAAVAWLRAQSAIEGGVRQVAAAAALRPGDEGRGGEALRPSEVSAAERAADSIVAQAAGADIVGRSSSPDTRSTADQGLAQQLAHTSLGQASDEFETVPISNLRGLRLPSVSTIVHGTASYRGAWWTPYGDFHNFLKGGVSPELYDSGQYYHWSGKYSADHREVAAQRLVDWATPYGGHLKRVYAHSYGGIVALRALGLGLRVDELVLLSTPVETVTTELRNAGRICSLRIHLDLVLLAARRRQAFDLPIAEFHLPKWFVGHDDSHNVGMWTQHDVARILDL